MPSESIYKRLTGKRRMLHQYTQLWLAPDHLLLIESSRMTEAYRRFYFADIQAITVTAKPSPIVMRVALASLSAVIIALSLTLIPIIGWKVLVAILGAIPALILVDDLVRGERCTVTLKTPVSTAILPPLSRTDAARRVISQLRPAIEQAQGAAWSPELGLSPRRPPFADPGYRATPGAGRILIALFSLITLDAIVWSIARSTGNPTTLSLLATTVFTEFVLAIAALLFRRTDHRWLLYALAGVAIACTVLELAGGIGLFVYFIFQTGQTSGQSRPPTSVDSFLSLFYPQALMWYGFGWRAILASVAWISVYASRDAGGGQESAPSQP